jgi:O-antigen/teichoic acid export membrane protein
MSLNVGWARRAQRLLTDVVLKRLFSGAGWSLVTWSASQAIILLSSVVVARLLGPEEYGKFSLILNTLNSFTILGTFGVGLAATREVARFRSVDRIQAGQVVAAAQSVTVMFAAAVVGILIAASAWVAAAIMNTPALRVDLQISALLLLFTILINTQGGILGGLEDFRSLALATIFRAIVTLALVFMGARLFGMRGAIVFMTLGTIVGWIATQLAVRRSCAAHRIPVPFLANRAHLRTLVNFSFPAMLVSIIPGPSIWLSNSMLAHVPGGYVQVGIVNAAYQIRNILILIPATVASAITPVVSSLHSLRDNRGIRRAFLAAVTVSGACAAGLLIPLLIFSNQIMGLFGPQFRMEGPVLIVMSIAGALLAVTVPVGNLIAGAGNIWWGVLLNAIWAAILLGSGRYFLTVHPNAMSIAESHLLAYGLHILGNLFCVVKILKPSGAALAEVETETAAPRMA